MPVVVDLLRGQMLVGTNVARSVACLLLALGAATAGVRAQKAADMSGSLSRLSLIHI